MLELHSDHDVMIFVGLPTYTHSSSPRWEPVTLRTAVAKCCIVGSET